MLKQLAVLVYHIDRCFPRTRVEGRESEQAYSEWEYRVGKELLSRYAGYFGSLDGRRVLDIGCGLGGKTAVYAESGAYVVGVDIDRRNIIQSISFTGARGTPVSFTIGDAEVLPFADESFDLVVANDSLEHFAHPERALPELARVVRPGGNIFLFFTPWGSPLGSHLYDYIRTPWCHLIFPERLMEAVLEVVLQRQGISGPGREAARLMEDFRTGLNRITTARYHRILEGTPVLETVMEDLQPPKFAFLKPLCRVPLVGELFTGTVIGILRKSG